MTGGDIAAIITAAGFLITAITGAAALLQGIRNSRVLQDVKTQTDGINSKLITKAAVAEATAAGVAEGHAEGLDQGRKEERK